MDTPPSGSFQTTPETVLYIDADLEYAYLLTCEYVRDVLSVRLEGNYRFATFFKMLSILIVPRRNLLNPLPRNVAIY